MSHIDFRRLFTCCSFWGTSFARYRATTSVWRARAWAADGSYGGNVRSSLSESTSLEGNQTKVLQVFSRVEIGHRDYMGKQIVYCNPLHKPDSEKQDATTGRMDCVFFIPLKKFLFATLSPSNVRVRTPGHSGLTGMPCPRSGCMMQESGAESLKANNKKQCQHSKNFK